MLTDIANQDQLFVVPDAVTTVSNHFLTCEMSTLRQITG